MEFRNETIRVVIDKTTRLYDDAEHTCGFGVHAFCSKAIQENLLCFNYAK